MTPLLSLEFERSPTTPWEIRQAIDTLWRDVPSSVLPTARLLASELATWAVLHGTGSQLRVAVLAREANVLVELVDDGDGFGDQSFRLVAALAHRWGAEDGGSRIWFELDH